MSANPKKLPLVHIIGLPGAGKTTLSKRLSAELELPVFCIGTYRARNPQTVSGELDAWRELFQALASRKWKNCILETTGLNHRESILRGAAPFQRRLVLKLIASRKTLYDRIARKKKCEQGGSWLFENVLPDKRAFVRRLYPKFEDIPADCCIQTDKVTAVEVYRRALEAVTKIDVATNGKAIK